MDFKLDGTFGFSLRDEGAFSRADLVWQDYAVAVGYDGNATPSGIAVAQLINENANSALTPVDHFQLLNNLVESASGYEPGENPSRVNTLITGVRPEILSAIIASQQHLAHRKRALQELARIISPGAILVLVGAAARAYNRSLSPVLAALLAKLAREAEELPPENGPRADRAFRDLFSDIVNAWSGDSLDMVSSGFDSMFNTDVEYSLIAHAGSVAPEPRRIVELAFETGAMGGVVWTALAKVGETEEGVRRIVDMVKRAPRGSRAARIIAQQFANPMRLSLLLREEPVDFMAVDSLLEHMGESAAGVLLDALVEATSRSTRRNLLDRLAKIGPFIGTMATERLKNDERWYVQRNMLTLLREANCSIDQVPLDRFTSHSDIRVRREATELLFLRPRERDRALASALRDNDATMLKVALRAARTGLPEAVVPLLAKRVFDKKFPPEFRTAALQLLSRSSSILALESLLRFASGGTTLLGKPKLAAKSPEMLIALSGLARAWPTERRALVLVALARESKDPDIQKAVAPELRGPFVASEKDVLDDE